MVALALQPGHILIYSREEAEHILGSAEGNQTSSDALSVNLWSTNTYTIGLIATEGQTIDAVVLMRKGTRLPTTTDKYHVFFDHIVSIAPITHVELARKKQLTLFKQYRQPLLNIIPPEQWHILISVIKALRPESASRIEELEHLLNTPPVSRRARPRPPGGSTSAQATAALERDALHTAFQLSGFSSSLIADSTSAARSASMVVSYEDRPTISQ